MSRPKNGPIKKSRPQRVPAAPDLCPVLKDAALIEQCPIALQIYDAEGTLVFVNRTWEQQWDRRASDVVGRVQLFEVLPLDPNARRLVEKAFSGESAELPETRIVPASGDEGARWICGRAYPMKGDRRQGRYVVIATADITERKTTEAALEASQAEMRLLLGNIPDHIATFDRDGTVLFINKTPPGFEREEILGTDWLRHTAPESLDEYRRAFEAVWVTERTVELEVEDVHSRFYWTRFIPFRKGGRLASVMAVATDVTERKKNERELETLNRELELRVAERTNALKRANEDLEAFAHTVAHDLKAPLRAISGFTEILAETDGTNLGPESRRFLDNIDEAARRMERLIEGVLAHARLGRVAARKERVAISDVLARVLKSLDSRIRARSAVVEVTATLPVIETDPTLLGRILSNLLDNALTYLRPDAVPRIAVHCEETKHSVTIGVADNGVGIPDEHLERVFEVFERLHHQEDAPGSGIGLAIARKAAHLLGGEIEARSKVGVGTEFRLVLPRPGHEQP